MKNLSKELRRYNKWRRGSDTIPQPNPTELGKLIEDAADRLEYLEELLEKKGKKK